MTEQDSELADASCALVSVSLMAGEQLGLIYREQPFSPQDSGWRLFSGEESGAYIANPDNVLMVPLGTLCKRFTELEPLLDAPPGSCFERGANGVLSLVEGDE